MTIDWGAFAVVAIAAVVAASVTVTLFWLGIKLLCPGGSRSVWPSASMATRSGDPPD